MNSEQDRIARDARSNQVAIMRIKFADCLRQLAIQGQSLNNYQKDKLWDALGF